MLSEKKMGTLIKKYKAGWSLLGPPRLKRLHYKGTDNNWHIQTFPHIYFTNSYKHFLLISLWGGLSDWHTTPSLKCGGPLPRIPPLTDTMSGVKKGVNPLNLVKSFLIKKSPYMSKKLFGKKSLKSRDTPIFKNKFSGKFLRNLDNWSIFVLWKHFKEKWRTHYIRYT